MTDQTTTLSPIDYSAAERMWAEYAAARPEAAALCPEHTVERFGDSDALADALLHEVLHGTKRATAELADEFIARGDPLPRIGSHWILCDDSGHPRVVLRTGRSAPARFPFRNGGHLRPGSKNWTGGGGASGPRDPMRSVQQSAVNGPPRHHGDTSLRAVATPVHGVVRG